MVGVVVAERLGEDNRMVRLVRDGPGAPGVHDADTERSYGTTATDGVGAARGSSAFKLHLAIEEANFSKFLDLMRSGADPFVRVDESTAMEFALRETKKALIRKDFGGAMDERLGAIIRFETLKSMVGILLEHELTNTPEYQRARQTYAKRRISL